MTAIPRPIVPQTRDRASQVDLDSDPRPLIAIDVDAAEILAVNRMGSQALGLFPYASFPIALDPAMPAMIRLRELAASNGAAGTKGIETLTFWNNGRLKQMLCRVAADGGARHVILRVVDDGDVEYPGEALESLPALEKRNVAEPSVLAAIETSGPRIPRTDAETLKEIARQIRTGGFSNSALRDGSPADVASKATDRLGEPARRPAEFPQDRADAVLDPDHLAKLAHELKTPLTAIAAAAEIMRDERLGEMGNERYLSYAADIHESATHALDVITSLLSESGKQAAPAPRLIALDLNAIVERTVSSVQALAQSRGLTLVFDVDKCRPHIVANPTALRQILLNLLTNAIKFTPGGGDVRVVTGYLNDGRVFLVVRDTGCGMTGNPPKVSEAAAFDEAAPSWSRGNGIGLPLVRRLVRDMGAEVEIDSAPGKGTVVLIAFGGYARWSA